MRWQVGNLSRPPEAALWTLHGGFLSLDAKFWKMVFVHVWAGTGEEEGKSSPAHAATKNTVSCHSPWIPHRDALSARGDNDELSRVVGDCAAGSHHSRCDGYESRGPAMTGQNHRFVFACSGDVLVTVRLTSHFVPALEPAEL
jgi:hypothetical protein